MALPPGRRLGPYEITAKIGAGGMGEVYKARDIRLDRTVAIKILPENLAADPQFRERFDREARTISQLDHPHICALHDVGEDHGTAFLVMQYLEGQTLADRLKKGPLPIDQALKCAIEIADALDRAHRAGVVHRDLKPGNIMLTKSGAKLLDFGLAKTGVTVVGSAASRLPTTPPELTAAGSILGTFQYMAPEQLEGKEADARSDIFAFGAVAYEMVTGRKAFEGRSKATLIAAILDRDPPAMSTLQPLAPPSLERIVRQCLAKAPDDRWQSSHDLVAELKWIGDVGAGLASVAPAAKVGAWRFAIGGVLAGVAITALAAWFIARGTPSARPIHVAMSFDTTATIIPSASRNPVAISPDGQRIVMVAIGRDGVRRLYLRLLDEPTANEVPGTENADGPSFSPDGTSLLFYQATLTYAASESMLGTLRRVALSGGGPQTIAPATDVRGASWGADGFIVFPDRRNTGLSRVPAAGGPIETLTSLDASQHEKSHRFPQVLPGGKSVLFTIGLTDTMSFDDACLAVVSLDTKQTRVVLRGGTYGRYSSSGHLVYARGGALFAVPFDLKKLEIVGTPVPVLTHLGMSEQFGTGAFDISSTGTLAYIPAPETPRHDHVVAVDRSGKSEVLLDTTALVQLVAASPDGSRLALNLGGANDSNWIYDVARKTTTRLSDHVGDARGLTWMPDGQRVTFGATLPFGIVSADADGSGREETVLPLPYESENFSWSRDGRYLAYSILDPQTSSDLWVYSAAERKTAPFLKTRFNEFLPSFSPDGRWIVYSSDESGRSEIYVRPFPDPGGKWQVSIEGGNSPLWAVDGKEIFYRKGSAVVAVPVATAGAFSAGVQHMLFDGPYLPGAAYSVLPDGKRFAMIERRRGDMPQHVNLVLDWFSDLQKPVASLR